LLVDDCPNQRVKRRQPSRFVLDGANAIHPWNERRVAIAQEVAGLSVHMRSLRERTAFIKSVSQDTFSIRLFSAKR
jgi:hypothetical protein